MTDTGIAPMRDRVVMGIDPGASGACAFYWPEAPGLVVIEDMPVVNGQVSGAMLADMIRRYQPTEAMVELVGSMPKQGVSSTFKFGFSTGIIHGTLGALNVPFSLVTPAKWKRQMGLSSDKEAARAMALRTFPAIAPRFYRKADHNRAEAALLAYYAAHLYRQQEAA